MPTQVKKSNDTKQKKSVIAAIAKTERSKKDKTISVKVNSSTYSQFQQINDMLGISNSAVINKFISEYVFENKKYLEE